MIGGRPRRSLGVLTSVGAWILIMVTIAGAARASGIETFRDQFDAVSYGGSNGSVAWSGSWIEFGDSGGATSGKVKVVMDSECVSGGCGYMSGSGAITAGIWRVADLTDASSATLSYSYRRTEVGNAPSIVVVAGSEDGGVGWTTLATHLLDATDSLPQVANVALTSFISADTTVRFTVVATPGQGGRFHFDDVEIAATFPDPTTTTTTTSTTLPPTTSSPPSSTTSTSSTSTTIPAPSTTTAAPVPTTTTTTPAPPTSSSTQPPTPSTTVPGPAPTSTTAAPPATTISPSSTSEPPVALPPGGSAPAPAPPSFPVPTARPGAALGSAGGAQAREIVNFETSNPDISSIVQLRDLHPLGAQAPLARSSAEPVLGGDLVDFLAYAWPAVVPLTALAMVEAIALRRERRRTANEGPAQ